MRPLSIGGLSRRTGCHVETIRYYERIGLLAPPPRSAGGHRLYGGESLKRLSFIRRARALGFSIQDVRALLRLVDGGDYSCDEVKAFTLDHLGDIRRKIADLKQLESALQRMAARCEAGKTPDCPIIAALFSHDRVAA